MQFFQRTCHSTTQQVQASWSNLKDDSNAVTAFFGHHKFVQPINTLIVAPKQITRTNKFTAATEYKQTNLQQQAFQEKKPFLHCSRLACTAVGHSLSTQWLGCSFERKGRLNFCCYCNLIFGGSQGV